MGIIDTLSRLLRRPRALPPAPAASSAPSKPVRGPMVQVHHGRLWEPGDDDAAKRQSERGQFRWLAEFCEAMRSDGLISGLLSTRSAGMWALPVSFDGDPWLRDALTGRPAEYDAATGARVSERTPSMWQRLLPRSEAVGVVEDFIMAGAGIGYLDDDPSPGGWRRLRHLDLHWLEYVHGEDAYYYTDERRGRLRVTPGDGRWLLITASRHRPWVRGSWVPVARPFIAKYGAGIDRLRWQKFLADGLRYLEQDDTASEAHADAMAQWIMEGWAYGPGVVLPKGFKAGVVEAGGKGYEVYRDAEDRADAEIMVALTGQKVTTEGVGGFSSGNLFRDIANTLIQATANQVAEALGEQVLDAWTSAIGLGREAIRASWDTRDPEQREKAAAAAKAAAEAVDAINKAAAPYGERARLGVFFEAHGVAVELESATGVQGAPPSPPPGVAAILSAPEASADPPEDGAAAELAAKMTEHGVATCEHGSLNRCRLCGIERVRDFDVDLSGAPAWRIAWRPIARPAAAAAARSLVGVHRTGQAVAATMQRTVGGVIVVVEHPRGTVREGVGSDGMPWATPMLADYGRIPGTVGHDGEAVDAYVGPDTSSPRAWIVSQVHQDGTPDEQKVMLGFRSEEAARQAYLAHVPAWCFGGIKEVPTSSILSMLSGATAAR